MVSNMSDYAIFLDEAPNMEEEVDLSNRSTFLPFLKKSYAFWNMYCINLWDEYHVNKKCQSGIESLDTISNCDAWTSTY